MLRHAQEAHDLMLKRQAEKEAEEKRVRDEAEGVLQKYLTCETDHPEIVEELADAATLLGVTPAVLLAEGGRADELEKTFEELDTLEYRFRAADAETKDREAHLIQQHWSAERISEDHFIYVSLEQARGFAKAHENRLRLLNADLQKWHYARPIPPRYRMGLQQLVNSNLPPAELPLSERDKPAPPVLPERPDPMDLLELGGRVGNEARYRVIEDTVAEWEAAAEKVTREYEAKMRAHEARVKEAKASVRAAKADQKTADVES